MNLDDKLDYILKSNAAVQRCADKDALDDYDKLIPQIKQIFADEGYINIVDFIKWADKHNKPSKMTREYLKFVRENPGL